MWGGSENKQFVNRCWYFVAGCSKVNRESAGVKPCIALRCVSVLIRVRACVRFRFSNSRMFIPQDYDVMCDLFCRSQMPACLPAFPSCREGRAAPRRVLRIQ